jgi:hypothetical protein
MNQYSEGIPKSSFLIRELLNELVAILVEKNGNMDYVVRALKIDPGNEKLKTYLMK